MPPIFTRDIQRTLLRIRYMAIFGTCTGLSPSMVRRSRRLLLHEFRQRRPKPHISPKFPRGIRFVLFRVHSPLLTESRLISFPRPTKMLQFGRFPFPNGNVAKRQEVLFGNLRIQEIHASPRSLSQLVTTFFSSRAEPFPRQVL